MEDKGVHTFPKGICPKVNVIARLEYELAYYDSAVHRFNHYTTRTPLDNRVKQSNITAPTLFTIYFATIFVYASHDRNKIWLGASGWVFKLTDFNSKPQTSNVIIRKLLFAYDSNFVLTTWEIHRVSWISTCVKFCLMVILKKIK